MAIYNIQENTDLTHLNTFGIHAQAEFFINVKNADEIQELLQDLNWKNAPKYVLGGGSNILFSQDFSGLLIKNEIRGIKKIAEDDHHVFLKLGAGENWHAFVMHCIQQGWGGIENLSLIPGTIGAAPIQNIGAYGVEFKEVFQELMAIRLTDGAIKTFDKTACQFGYRDSVFKSSCKNQYMILYVVVKLSKNPTFNTHYAALHDKLKEMHVTELNLKTISDAVIQIRRSKLPDPNLLGNAGSFFKNPILSSADFTHLQKKHPTMPFFLEDSENAVKIPAGWLIEQCGWKGKRIGDVGVHDKQALVIVNYGMGTGEAIRELAQDIQKSVYTTFGISLIPEVNIL